MVEGELRLCIELFTYVGTKLTTTRVAINNLHANSVQVVYKALPRSTETAHVADPPSYSLVVIGPDSS